MSMHQPIGRAPSTQRQATGNVHVRLRDEATLRLKSRMHNMSNTRCQRRSAIFRIWAVKQRFSESLVSYPPCPGSGLPGAKWRSSQCRSPRTVGVRSRVILGARFMTRAKFCAIDRVLDASRWLMYGASALAAAAMLYADAPDVHAIRGARIVTAAGD